MRVKSLKLKDFKGYANASIEFRDFSILIGPNGIGKTTALEAVNLLASSLDFRTEIESVPSFGHEGSDWVPTVSAQQRLEQFLKRNIRNGKKAFRLEGVFEHAGRDYKVVLTEKGFETNELLGQPFWNSNLVLFAKFDLEMSKFLLPEKAWPAFKLAFENITGYQVSDPIVFDEGGFERIVDGFTLHKPNGKIPFKFCSAGEKKIARALSNIVLIDEEKKPHIVLVDNIEMHVHYKRHLGLMGELRRLFTGMQVISTTHSTVVMEKHEPREDLVDIELINVTEVPTE